MIELDESSNYLLNGPLFRCRSDDFELDAEDEIFPDKLPLYGRTGILHQMKKVVTKLRPRGKGNKREIRQDDKENMANIANTRSQVTTNLSSYDERSILEDREGPVYEGRDLNDTASTVSSLLSTATNQKRQQRMISQWRNRMKSSIRKIVRKEIEDEIKGNPSKYHDFSLYVYPEDSVFSVSRNRKKSAFDLVVPSLETPPESRDEASNLCQYPSDDDFPIEQTRAKQTDESTLQEASRKGESPVDEAMKQVFQGALSQRKNKMDVSEPEFQRPMLKPSKSNLFVSFDEDMAQLIFDVPSSETETEDFQAVEVHSVASDIENLSDDDENFAVTYPTYKVGAEFGHPGVPKKCPSSETETSPKRLGISCGHQTWYGRRQNRDEQLEVWSKVDAPMMDGEITDPPSPTPIKTSREDYWCLGVATSTESDITMTDVLVNKHGCFPTDFPSLPDMPLIRTLLDKYPYDEDSGGQQKDYGARKRPDPPAQRQSSTSMASFFQRTAWDAFSDDHEQDEQANFKNRLRQEKVKCGCVKCTAKSIYQDLLNCNGGSVD
jgi:cell pole-organizing protein PopZ